MTHTVLSLGLGLALIIVANLALGRRLGGGRATTVVTVLTLLVYIPYAILFWPGADVFAIHLALYLVVNLGFGMLRGNIGARQGTRWAPAVIVSFFIVIGAANTVFLIVSEQGLSSSLARALFPEPRGVGPITSSFPGTMVPGMTTRQQLYDRHLEQMERQVDRGWRVRKGWLQAPVVGQPSRFQVAVEDAAGRPVEGAEIDGDFLRAANPLADRKFSMIEVRSGTYQAELTLSEPGTWSLWLRVRREGELHYLRGNTTVAPADAAHAGTG